MKNWKHLILGVFFILSFLFLCSCILERGFIGHYKIDSYWIGNDSNGIKYCNNCLWIRFDEGCNRYKDYYFENQHELDTRLKVGMPVQIYFTKQGTISNVEPRQIYSYCSRFKYEFYNNDEKQTSEETK